MHFMPSITSRRLSEIANMPSVNRRNSNELEEEDISILSSNATPAQVTYGVGSLAANGPRVVPGTITSGGRVGERLSVTAAGNRLNSNSPVSGSANFRGSVESVRNGDRTFGGSASKSSIIDMVSSKMNINRNKTPQRYFSRESLAAGCANRIGADIEMSRIQKHLTRRRSQDRRGTLSACNKIILSGNMTNGNAAPNDRSNDREALTGSSGEEDRQILARKKRRGKNRYCGMRWTFVFDPAGRLTYYWHMVVSMAFLYNLWVIIFRFSFREITWDTVVMWFSLDYLCDFVYVMDLMISFRTGYLEDGVLQTDTIKLRQNYMNSTLFYLDCLSLLPLDFLYLSIGFNSMLRAFRLVKVYRFCAFMDRTERHTNYPNVFRSFSLLHCLMVTFHWNGCLYFILVKNNSFHIAGGTRDLFVLNPLPNETFRIYLQSYYWCTLALTTVGDLPRPRNSPQYCFVILQLLFGVLLFATILGHVSSIVASIGLARKEFQAKLDGVKTYMRMRRVPAPLQTKVIRWFDYLWLTQKCSDEEKAISCLPDKLKAEIAINVHLDTLRRVEIFQNTEAGFLCELVLKLRPVLFSPGDYICRKGEVGKEMYIVSRGKLQVVADDGKTVLATLRAGSYFGEISILNMGTAGNRRTASVRSVGYSDLFVLSKKDMWDVLKEYPAARIRLEEIATKRLEKYRTDPEPYDITGLFGRRCRSTPGIIESHNRIPLDEMWLSPYSMGRRGFMRGTAMGRFHHIYGGRFKSALNPGYRINMPSSSPVSIRSSGHSSDQEQHYRDRIPRAIPTISQTVSDNSGIGNDLVEVTALKAEINRLQDQLKDVEYQNKFLNEKLTQQQWDMDHRLAEIEMQICRDTNSSIGSSLDENERNRESII